MYYGLKYREMRNQNVIGILQQLVNSLRNNDRGLEEILVRILRSTEIKKDEPFSWKKTIQTILTTAKGQTVIAILALILSEDVRNFLTEIINMVVTVFGFSF